MNALVDAVCMTCLVSCLEGCRVGHSDHKAVPPADSGKSGGEVTKMDDSSERAYEGWIVVLIELESVKEEGVMPAKNEYDKDGSG